MSHRLVRYVNSVNMIVISSFIRSELLLFVRNMLNFSTLVLMQDPNIAAVREKVLPSVTQHLVKEIVSPNQTIRQQVCCLHCICQVNTSLHVHNMKYTTVYYLQVGP